MIETIVSPGVLAIENDQSFITEQPIQAGAAIIGPTVKGKVGIPTLCTTYSDYLNKYGSTFISGGQVYSYFTSISAYNYFNNGGGALLVTRVASGSFTPATSSVIPTSIAATSASLSLDLTYVSASVAAVGSSSFGVNGVTFYFTGSTVTNTSTVVYVNTASFVDSTLASYAFSSSAIFNVSSSAASYSGSLQYISSSASPTDIIFTYIGSNGLLGNLQYVTSGSTTTYFTGGTNTESFILETLSEGVILNSAGSVGLNGTLTNGTIDNYRWQIVSPNSSSGTFTLLIRQGNDSSLSTSIVETWTNLSLDPLSPRYIERIIGNQTSGVTQDGNDYYVQDSGLYPNNSRYVRVKQVLTSTPYYLDNNGIAKPEFTGSIPVAHDGVFGGAIGDNVPSTYSNNYYQYISNNNTQGLNASDYNITLQVLSNKDAYKYNYLTLPGLVYNLDYPSHISTLTTAITNIQNRGDSFLILDITGYGDTTIDALSSVSLLDTSYAAAYYPWILTIDPNSGLQVWIPPSTLIAGTYAFSDNISAPWIAPAGLTRGVLTTAVRAERFLSQGVRDTLYESNINPIATFQSSGVTLFGQKTLQKKQSSLDRINVRRLLIELKNFITQVADTLVFEPNTEVTRNNFLSQVNPYLSSVQQRQGLTAYKVVMDATLNTNEVIDQNQLIGQIYIQPTRTAEFILLEFNILPTGAEFPE
jgi:hypothetical protein